MANINTITVMKGNKNNLKQNISKSDFRGQSCLKFSMDKSSRIKAKTRFKEIHAI